LNFMQTDLPILKCILSTFCLVLITSNTFAQKKMKLGYVRDSATHQPLVNVLVTNEDTHTLTHTDDKGFFRVEANDGALIFFNAQNYRYDTLRYGAMTPDTATVNMAPLANELAAVTVTAKGYSIYQQDSAKRRQAFLLDAGSPKMQTISKSNSDAGIALNLDPILKKKDRSKRKAFKTFDEIEQTNYVDYRFSRDIVSGYTGLQGDALSDFMEKYRPTYEWLRDHPADDDVFYYINDKLKEYSKKKK